MFYVWNNEQREDMIDAARAVNVHFSVQVVYNHERRPVHVVAGDIVRAHHRAARVSVNHLATDFATNADIVVVNADPKGAQLHEHLGRGESGGVGCGRLGARVGAAVGPGGGVGGRCAGLLGQRGGGAEGVRVGS